VAIPVADATIPINQMTKEKPPDKVLRDQVSL
jgi:hypothetical protein